MQWQVQTKFHVPQSPKSKYGRREEAKSVGSSHFSCFVFTPRSISHHEGVWGIAPQPPSPYQPYVHTPTPTVALGQGQAQQEHSLASTGEMQERHMGPESRFGDSWEGNLRLFGIPRMVWCRLTVTKPMNSSPRD